MPTIQTASGIEIAYETHGDGPPLLLISGAGHDRGFWAGQLPLLASSYRCIVFDNRGTGASTMPPPGYSLADMADDAAAVLETVFQNQATERAHVMGFSMGGHIAQELALNHPARVASLAIHHSWARNCARLASFQRLRKSLAECGLREELADVSLLGLFAQDYFQDHPDEMAARKERMLAAMADLTGWIGQLEACLNGDTLDRLGVISIPTLVTCSDRDMIVAPHRAEEIHGAIAGARLEVLEGTGHVALIERPQAFARLCFDFLQGLGD